MSLNRSIFRIPSRNFWSKSTFNSSKPQLAEIFNVEPSSSNYLRHASKTGLFNVPELYKHSGFLELQEECVSKTNDLIQEALNPKRTRKMVEVFDEMSDSLCRVADLAEFIRLAHPVPEFSKAAEKACITISEIVEELNTNRKLYDNLKDTVFNGDVKSTTYVDNLVAELFLFDFEQNGIHLPEHLRNAVVSLNNNILNLGQQFVAGSDSPRVIRKTDVPNSIQHLFQSDGDHIIVSGLLADSPNPVIREIAYKIYYHTDENQNQLLHQLLECRFNLAKICGFKSYSERVLKGGIIDNNKDVMTFLDTISTNIEKFSDIEFEQMRKMKSSDNGVELALWDVPYYTMRAKQEWFKVTRYDYSPYFSLGACMEGLNVIFKNLYGISLEINPTSDGECWSKEVYKLAVQHESEGTLGYIYCDFYERPGKQSQDCHFSIRGGKELSDGSYQIPIAVLMLNFKPPTWGMPSLLTPHNVDNLFHEMGHAMHSMLARTKYQHVAGTRCSTDLAEVPSVLMEYFASDPRILRLFARHYQTNAPIPEEMLHKLCASKKLFTASETRMQVFYSVLDQMFHSEDPFEYSSNDAVGEIQEKYYNLKYVPNTAWHLRFSHLVGYGAKYYSYLVSRSVAHSIWNKYFRADPLNREVGERYRTECLSFGGSKNPKELVVDFLKISASPQVFADSLVTDISENHEAVRKYNSKYKIF